MDPVIKGQPQASSSGPDFASKTANAGFIAQDLNGFATSVAPSTVGSSIDITLTAATSALGLYLNGQSFVEASKKKDTNGKLYAGMQLARFSSRSVAAVTSLASNVLKVSKVATSAALNAVSGAFSTVASASLTAAFALRVYDVRKLEKTELDPEQIRKEFIDFSANDLKRCGVKNPHVLDQINRHDWSAKPEITGLTETHIEELFLMRKGKIDRLGRALGDADLAKKLADGKEVDLEGVKKKFSSNRMWVIAILVTAILTDITKVIILALTPIIGPAAVYVNFAINSLWTVIDAKFFLDDIKSQPHISTKLKVIYVAMAVLAVAGIVAASIATFGTLPMGLFIGIGVASAVAAIALYIAQHREKRRIALESLPPKSRLQQIKAEAPIKPAIAPPKRKRRRPIAPVKAARELPYGVEIPVGIAIPSNDSPIHTPLIDNRNRRKPKSVTIETIPAELDEFTNKVANHNNELERILQIAHEALYDFNSAEASRSTVSFDDPNVLQLYESKLRISQLVEKIGELKELDAQVRSADSFDVAIPLQQISAQIRLISQATISTAQNFAHLTPEVLKGRCVFLTTAIEKMEKQLNSIQV